MRNKPANLMLVAVIGILVLAACGSDSDDVPSLNKGDTQAAEPVTDTVDVALDDEARVMAFVQCMRDEGIEFKDPVVDSDGNVQRPEYVKGFTATREQLGAAMEVCGEHLEGLTLGRERKDVSEQVDQFVAVATCLRDKGFDVDDPTVETFEQWATDFRVEFDWEDPKAMAAYEECSGAD